MFRIDLPANQLPLRRITLETLRGVLMKRLSYGFAMGVTLWAATIGPNAAVAAQPELSALQGAWLEQSMACGDVYASKGKGVAFKNPASMFAPAFIVSGSQIRTPYASCRIISLKPDGDRQALALGCSTQISVTNVKALVSLKEDGTLYRYLNDGDTTGSKYQRCTPKDISAGQGSGQ
jgi:hypothetical protein